MGCSTCTYLEEALRSRNGEYVEACSGTYSQFSSRFVAYDAVEMERAQSELQMHRSVCASAIADAGGPRQEPKDPAPPASSPTCLKT